MRRTPHDVVPAPMLRCLALKPLSCDNVTPCVDALCLVQRAVTTLPYGLVLDDTVAPLTGQTRASRLAQAMAGQLACLAILNTNSLGAYRRNWLRGCQGASKVCCYSGFFWCALRRSPATQCSLFAPTRPARKHLKERSTGGQALLGLLYIDLRLDGEGGGWTVRHAADMYPNSISAAELAGVERTYNLQCTSLHHVLEPSDLKVAELGSWCIWKQHQRSSPHHSLHKWEQVECLRSWAHDVHSRAIAASMLCSQMTRHCVQD